MSERTQNVRRSSARVLIVEDEFIVGLDLRRIVQELGFRAVGPIPGVAPALAVVEGVPLDAALLDVMLDDGLSFPVADALDRAGVPYVFVTAVRHLIEDEERLASRPVVTKPFQAEAIESALNACGVRAERK